MFWSKQNSQISLTMLLTHLLIFASTRGCLSFVYPSSQSARTHITYPTILLSAKDTVKPESNDLQDEEDDWEWDGNPIEGAHDAEFEDGSGAVDEFFLSADFMSMANSVTSPALSVIGTGGSSSTFDQSKNAGKLHLMDEEDFDLEEIGGDAGFLDEEDTEIETEFGKIKFNKSMDDDLFWEVDEDAHFD